MMHITSPLSFLPSLPVLSATSSSTLLLPRHLVLFITCFFLAAISFHYAFASLDLHHLRWSLTRRRQFAQDNNPKQSSTAAKSSQIDIQCEVPNNDVFRLQPIGQDVPDGIKRYARWHTEALHCLHDAKCLDKPNILIFHCQHGQSCGGMGDRLRGIHHTFGIAMATQRLFFIDLPGREHSLFPLEVALQPVSIDWRLPNILKVPDENVLLPLVPRRRLGLTSTLRANDTLQLNWAFAKKYGELSIPAAMTQADYDDFDVRAERLIRVMDPSDALNVLKAFETFPRITRIASNAPHGLSHGMFANALLFENVAPDLQSYSFSEVMKHVTHTLFMPSPAVERLANAVTFRPQFPFVAVHARTGGDVDEVERPRFAAMANNYTFVTSTLLECVVERNRRNYRRIYLASDSSEFKDDFVRVATERYGINVRTMQEKAVHIGQQVSEEEEWTPTQNDCRDFLNVFVDIVAMSKAEFIVSTGSGFSKMAFLIGHSPKNLFIGYSSKSKRFVCRPDFIEK